MPAVLAALCLVVALIQRPGADVADTKVHLYVAPQDFLRDVLSAWTPTGDLGHVWAGQYGGYAWPMGPWFAGGDWLGLPSWVVHRLWLAALLFAAAWGVVVLLRALWRPDGGHALLFGGVLYVINPYVTVYANRTSIALLAYAALPWLLLAVHRGLQDPRGWRWPAIFALVLTCAGGGVNAAVTGWVLLAPALLVAYEAWLHRVRLWPWLWRLAVVNVVASAWWVVPLLVHAKYGTDFLPFTEQPGTIWGTSSLSESLRLMGFWTSYIGVGYGRQLVPFAGHTSPLLFSLPIVLSGLLVPAIVLASTRWTLRNRYAPFFLVLTLLGLVVMAAGWPEGTPLRQAATFTYNHVSLVQVLRTTYKAGPLVALGIACLGAMAPRRWLLAPLVLVAAWPLTTGRALERQLQFDLPQGWRDVAAQLDRRGDDSRALLVPGQLFSAHTWGETIDSVLPALTHDRPVATRNIVPYADLRSVDVQWSVDRLLTERRTVPGQLPSLLDLMAVGDVVQAGDLDRRRGGGLKRVDDFPPAPKGRVASVTRTGTAGIVRVLPRGPLTVVDGGAGALTGLAAFGALQPGQPIVHAADATTDEVRRAGRVVISDTNRRQAFVPSRPRGGAGRVLAPDEDVSQDGVVFDPWHRADAETVQVLHGVRALRSPFSPQVRQAPEHRPFAAFDGDERTSWLADRVLADDRHWLEVVFDRPRDVPSVRLLPASDARGVVREVAVAGRRFPVAPHGWTTLRLGLRKVASLRVTITKVDRPRRASAGAGGLRELQVPGLRVTEALRPPVIAERALAGRDLQRTALTYLFERFTAEDPYLRGRQVGEAQAGDPRDRQDPETQLRRTFTPPAARTWTLSAWVHADPLGGDGALDRLAGTTGKLRATGSSRFQGRPRYRASSAFDGTDRPWVAELVAGEPAWLSWRTPRAQTLRRFRMTPVTGLRVRFPTRVRLTVDRRVGPALPVGVGGLVALPAPVRGRLFRLEVLATRGERPWRRAVGIGELRAAGLPRLHVPRRGVLRAPCGSAAVLLGGRGVPLRVDGDLRAFDAGRPLRADGCRPARLPARTAELRGLARPLVVDRLRLEGAATLFVAAGGGGRVVEQGDEGDGERTGTQVVADGDAWLVLGETTSPGWRASCDGRDLGPPRTLQGYANGWPITAPGCDDVEFRFAPNHAVAVSGWISLIGCLLLLAFVLVRGRRAPAPPALDRTPWTFPDPAPLPLRRAVLYAAPLAVAIAFLFALRAGAVAAPLLVLVLWRGIATRRLLSAAGALLVVVVPLLYLVAGPTDRGGFPKDYAGEHLAAHWVTVAAWVLLAISAARALRAARRGSGPSGPRSPRTTEATPGPGGSTRLSRARAAIRRASRRAPRSASAS